MTKVKESTPEPKRFNPDGSEHYCYPTICQTEEGVINVCNSLIKDGYINFTVYHTVNKCIVVIPTTRMFLTTSHKVIHIYIPK